MVPDVSQRSHVAHTRHNWTMVHPTLVVELNHTGIHTSLLIRTMVLNAISSAGLGLRATLSLHMFFHINSAKEC